MTDNKKLPDCSGKAKTSEALACVAGMSFASAEILRAAIRAKDWETAAKVQRVMREVGDQVAKIVNERCR